MTLVRPHQQETDSARAAGCARDTASFRDPSGFVFEHGGHIYRAVDARVLGVLGKLADYGLLGALMAEGLLVGTRRVDEPALLAGLRAIAPHAEGFLQHARVPVLSYPYEWSPAMLADAALLTLDLQERLLARGFALKDATAYNVQFVNSRPVFIDLPSIEQPVRADVWHAFGQFQRMFNQPLLLHHRRGQSLRGYFLASLDGASPEEAARAFGWIERMTPALLFDVTLPAWLGRRSMNNRSAPPVARPRTAGDPRAQLWNLRRVRAKIARFARESSSVDHWTEYTETCNYAPESAHAKQAEVRAFLEETRPATVLDAGCNTGTYALLAAELGSRVVAIDSDVACVDAVYRAARRRRAAILPLCIDLANPSPAIGFRNRERPAFLDRAGADCVLALALIHHLHVAANLPLTGICDLFADLAKRHLVLEFVPPGDSKFEELTRFRNQTYPEYTLDECIRTFRRRFSLIRQTRIPQSNRTLVFWRRRNS